MKNSFEIDSDCLEIVRRIKSIDEDYFVMFNTQKKTFQLHHRAQRGSTYCLTFPFDTLDERAYFFVLKTRVQNSDKIFAEMEKQNAQLEKAVSKQVLNEFLESIEEKQYESSRNN